MYSIFIKKNQKKLKQLNHTAMRTTTLIEYQPRPQPGEWFMISTNGSNKRTVCVIEQKGRTLSIRTAMGLSTGMANVFDPIKITLAQAREQVKQEIFDLENQVKITVGAKSKNVVRGKLNATNAFYARYFQWDCINLLYLSLNRLIFLYINFRDLIFQPRRKISIENFFFVLPHKVCMFKT